MSHVAFPERVKASTVESCLAVDAATFARKGALAVGNRGTTTWTDQRGREIGAITWRVGLTGLKLSITLEFAVKATGEAVRQVLVLDRTHPPVGGTRWWFLCPGGVTDGGCGRRVGKLYLGANPTRFACRHCWKLTYRSAQEHNPRLDRLRRSRAALLAELQGPRPSLAALKVALGGFV